MSADQLTNYLLIALIVVIAIGRGVEVALDFYIKKMQVMKKPVPKQVVDIRDKAEWLVSEASTMLDLTGEQKKEWVSNQLQQADPKLTTPEARGLTQNVYDKQNNATQDKTASTDNGGAVSLGTVEDDSDEKD